MLSTTLLIACLSQANPATVQQAPATLAVREFVKKLGPSLNADPILGAEILFVSIKSRPIAEVKDRLAKALGAVWIPDGAGERLVVDSQAVSWERAEAAQARIDAISRAFSKSSEDDQSRGYSQEDAEREFQAEVSRILPLLNSPIADGQYREVVLDNEGAGPARRLLASAVRAMGLGRLASLAPGSRTVFSNQPNRRQTAFPGNSSVLLSAFSRDQKILAQAYASRPGFGDRLVFNSPLVNQALGVNSAATRFILSLKLNDFGEPTKRMKDGKLTAGTGITASILVADQAGALVGRAALNFAATGDSVTLPEPEPVQGTIEISNAGRDLAGMIARLEISNQSRFSVGDGTINLATWDQDSVSSTPSPAARPFFEAPNRNEPLSAYVGPVLGQYASASGRDMIAVIPDRMLQAMASRLGRGTMPLTEVQTVFQNAGCDWKPEPGIITVQPCLRDAARAERINRDALSQILSSGLRQGTVQLSDLETYWRKAPARGSFDEVFLQVISTDAAESFYQYGGRVQPWMIVAGAQRLSQNQQPGQKDLPLQLLSPLAKATIVELAEEALQPNVGGSSISTRTSTTPPEPRSVRVCDLEFTELFPDGLPADVRLRIQTTRREGLARRANRSGKTRFYQVSELAGAARVLFDSEQTPGLTANSPEFSYHLATMTDYLLSLPNLNVNRGSFRDGQLAPGGTYQPWTSLSAAVREAFEKAYADQNPIRVLRPGQDGTVRPPQA